MPSYTPTIENPKREKALKLLRVALDPGARIGEALNAGAHFVKAARRDKLGVDDLFIAPTHQLPEPESERPDACDICLHFGKHDGESLLEIGQSDIDYLRWLATDFSKVHIRTAAGVVLEWLLQGGAA